MNPFRSYDALRVFVTVSRNHSFTAAGQELNLTKGAVSYQIKQLEKECGFKLFDRLHNRIALTDEGKRLASVAQLAFQDVEQEIASLRAADTQSITIGTTTYFASRWLSSRLMTFMSANLEIRLRLQPVVGWGDLQKEELDLMIRWGKADWSDSGTVTEKLFRCPAFPTAGRDIADQIDAAGLPAILPKLTLLHDHEESTAWQDWFRAAGIPYRPKQNPLVIADPNVRVEAVINGQGIALNDSLIETEIENGRLVQISPVELQAYGYFLIYPDGGLVNPALNAFRNWILAQP